MEDPEAESEVNSSHDLDMVTIFESANHDSEMEAMEVNGVLRANGIESMVVGASVIPSLAFRVEVPRADVEEAQRILTDARAAGTEAAEEAEAESEQQ